MCQPALLPFALPGSSPQLTDTTAGWNVPELSLLPASIVVVVLLGLVTALMISGVRRHDDQQPTNTSGSELD